MSYEKESHIREIVFGNDEWDDIVDRTPNAYVHYRSDYLDAFCDSKSGYPVMFVYECDSKIAINVAFKRDISDDTNFKNIISHGEHFDLMSPYGYGGYVGNVEIAKEVMKEHHRFCERRGYVSEVVKFHPLSDYREDYMGVLESPFHNVIRDLTQNMDTIWMDFKPKVRKNVKRARSSGVEIIIDKDGEMINDFIKVYYSTMERNEASDNYFFSKDFFDKINRMSGHYTYFHSAFCGKIISTELVIYDDVCCYSYLGGTDSEYYNLRPNDLLKYEIIKWGHNKGLKYFILGGGHGADDGIFQYKTALAPNGIVDFYVGTDIFAVEKYNKLCDIRKQQDKGFDENIRMQPAYRF